MTVHFASSPSDPMSRFVRQCALQAAAVFLAFSIAWPFYTLRAAEWHWPMVCAASGAFAFLMARAARQPWWWQVIHLLFVPALWIGLQLDIAPIWYLGGFFLLLGVLWGDASDRVLLYLSSAKTATQLARLAPQKARFIDIDAGIGSLLLPLFHLRPDLALVGIDNTPLLWLLGRLRVCKSGIAWHWGDFWRHSLSPYQTLYCFLSPAPMAELWRKACREMHPGSLLISKAFPISSVVPESILFDASVRDTLYVYRIPPQK